MAINKCLLNKILSLLILTSLIWVNLINVAVVTQNWNNTGSNVDVFTLALSFSIWVTKKSALSIAMIFHKNLLIVAWYTFHSIKIRTLTLSNSKY